MRAEFKIVLMVAVDVPGKTLEEALVAAQSMKDNVPNPPPIDGEVTALRWRLKQIAADVRGLRGHEFFREAAQPNCDHQEMIANIMLAFRHLEDARMRLGKILQAHDGGTSCYDQ